MDHQQTSRLETLVLSPDSATVALDGRKILIKGDGLAATRQAFQDLYDTALAEYEAGQARGLLAWLGRLVGKHRAGKQALDSQAIAAGYSASATSPQPSAARPALPSDPGQPSLHSIFADKDGIHIQWRFSQSDGRGARLNQTVDSFFALDSEVGRRLERCYDALSLLGYEVRTLADLAAPLQEKKQEAAAVQPASVTSASARPSEAAPRPEDRPDPQSKIPPPIVFRLHLKSGDSSARMLVAPVDDPDHPQVLVAHERMIRALQNASAESRPAEERVTFVRCVNGEKGLKVTEIGLGRGADRDPARWQDAISWWETTGKLLAKPPSLIHGPAFTTGSSPLQTGATAEPGIG